MDLHVLNGERNEVTDNVCLSMEVAASSIYESFKSGQMFVSSKAGSPHILLWYLQA